jgi:hypothetical protein
LSKFVYQKRTREQFNAVKNRRGGGFDSYIKREYKKYKMRDGKNLIRFLPPTWGTEDAPANHFAYEAFVNYDIGPDKQSYLSLAKMKQAKDPLDEARRTTRDQELAKALNPTRRWLAWIVDRMAPDEGPQVFDYPGKLNTAICTASTDEDTNEIVWVDDPKQGADVRFYKEGQGKTGTSYPGEKVKVLAVSPLSDDAAEAKEWLDFVAENPITKCLQYYEYDHISMVYNGAAKASDEEDDNETVDEETGEVKSNKTSTVEVKDEEDDGSRKTADTTTGSLRERLRQRREKIAAGED